MDIIKQLSPEGQDILTKNMLKRPFRKGSQVIMKGDSVSGVYFVLQGALRVFTLSADGRESTLYRMTPGDTCVLALNSFFNDVLYPAWVEADEDTTVGIVPGAAYRTLFATESAVQDITLSALSSAVFGLMTELETRHSQSLEQRLASYLILRSSSEAKVQRTQQEIASDLGTTREVIGRMMAQFVRQGLTRSGRGTITLTDKHALTRMADTL